MFGLYSLSGLALRFSPLAEDTSMITVSSCGVKLQELLSGLQEVAKTLNTNASFCGFCGFLLWLFATLIHSFFFLSSWGVNYVHNYNQSGMKMTKVQVETAS